MRTRGAPNARSWRVGVGWREGQKQTSTGAQDIATTIAVSEKKPLTS